MRLPQIFSESELRAILFLLVLTLVGETTLLIKRRHPGFLPDFIDVQSALQSGAIPDPEGDGAAEGSEPAGSKGATGDDASWSPPGEAGAGSRHGEDRSPDPGRGDVGAGAASARDRDPAGRPPESIDLNRASAAELDALPGIGPVLAKRIVDDREANGPFRKPEDLLRVRGIGPRLLERVRPHLRGQRANLPAN